MESVLKATYSLGTGNSYTEDRETLHLYLLKNGIAPISYSFLRSFNPKVLNPTKTAK
jgi:hypothetical protein